MSKFVPEVVVVQQFSDDAEELINQAVEQFDSPELRAICEKNGWTIRMLVLGSLIHDALGSMVPNSKA